MDRRDGGGDAHEPEERGRIASVLFWHPTVDGSDAPRAGRRFHEPPQGACSPSSTRPLTLIPPGWQAVCTRGTPRVQPVEDSSCLSPGEQACHVGTAGVVAPGHAREGSPGTWEASSLHRQRTAEAPLRPGPGSGTPCQGEGRRGSNESPGDGTGRRAQRPHRDGRGRVGAPHSTVEAREPTRGTRWREGVATSSNRWRERWLTHQGRQPSQQNNSG